MDASITIRPCHRHASMEVAEMIGIYFYGQTGLLQDGLPILKAFHRVLFECWVSRRVSTRTNKLTSIGQIVRSQEQFSESFGNRKFSCFPGWWRIKFR